MIMTTSVDTNDDCDGHDWEEGPSSREDYEKNPEWTRDVREKPMVDDDGDEYTVFYDKYGPNKIWIKAKRIYDLMRVR